MPPALGKPEAVPRLGFQEKGLAMLWGGYVAIRRERESESSDSSHSTSTCPSALLLSLSLSPSLSFPLFLYISRPASDSVRLQRNGQRAQEHDCGGRRGRWHAGGPRACRCPPPLSAGLLRYAIFGRQVIYRVAEGTVEGGGRRIKGERTGKSGKKDCLRWRRERKKEGPASKKQWSPDTTAKAAAHRQC